MKYVTFGVRDLQANLGKALRALQRGERVMVTSRKISGGHGTDGRGASPGVGLGSQASAPCGRGTPPPWGRKTHQRLRCSASLGALGPSPGGPAVVCSSDLLGHKRSC